MYRGDSLCKKGRKDFSVLLFTKQKLSKLRNSGHKMMEKAQKLSKILYFKKDNCLKKSHLSAQNCLKNRIIVKKKFLDFNEIEVNRICQHCIRCHIDYVLHFIFCLL